MIRVFGAAAIFLSLGACASGPSYDYYKIKARFVASAQDQQDPEIIATPAYNQLAGRAVTVAVRAPDRCSNATANEATGSATASGAILQTNCGVEMGEIERALTRAGYNVISWNVLAREMARNSSAAEVANSLGAQVLFQINSLERSTKTLGQDARWERSYFRTDQRGVAATPLPLPEATRTEIGQRYLTQIEANSIPRAYAVTLDASAIWVATGQSIWYYRWTRAQQPGGVAVGYDLPLACMQGYGWTQCQRFTPYTPPVRGGTVVAAGESVAVSSSERPEDLARAIYADLFKEVVGNFVGSFSKVRSLASAPLPPPPPAPPADERKAAANPEMP
jgi:hypothetical protein